MSPPSLMISNHDRHFSFGLIALFVLVSATSKNSALFRFADALQLAPGRSHCELATDCYECYNNFENCTFDKHTGYCIPAAQKGNTNISTAVPTSHAPGTASPTHRPSPHPPAPAPMPSAPRRLVRTSSQKKPQVCDVDQATCCAKTSCSDCTRAFGCGWQTDTETCTKGTPDGPTAICHRQGRSTRLDSSGWRYYPRNCCGFATSCAECVVVTNCTWTLDGRCDLSRNGTSTAGSLASQQCPSRREIPSSICLLQVSDRGLWTLRSVVGVIGFLVLVGIVVLVGSNCCKKSFMHQNATDVEKSNVAQLEESQTEFPALKPEWRGLSSDLLDCPTGVFVRMQQEVQTCGAARPPTNFLQWSGVNGSLRLLEVVGRISKENPANIHSFNVFHRAGATEEIITIHEKLADGAASPEPFRYALQAHYSQGVSLSSDIVKKWLHELVTASQTLLDHGLVYCCCPLDDIYLQTPSPNGDREEGSDEKQIVLSCPHFMQPPTRNRNEKAWRFPFNDAAAAWLKKTSPEFQDRTTEPRTNGQGGTVFTPKDYLFAVVFTMCALEQHCYNYVRNSNAAESSFPFDDSRDFSAWLDQQPKTASSTDYVLPASFFTAVSAMLQCTDSSVDPTFVVERLGAVKEHFLS